MLLLPLAALLIMAGCPLSKATYVLRGSGHDWLRIGPADDAEVVLNFYTGNQKTSSIPMKDVFEFGRIERLDAERHPVGVDFNNAPAFIRIFGLSKNSGGRSGEWRLAWCTKE